MSTDPHIFFAYTDEVLAFAWKDRADDVQPPAPPATEELERMAERSLRLFEKSHKDTLVLFGLCSGALATTLAERLPAETRLLICDLSPERTREVLRYSKPAWYTSSSRTQLLVDTSPWAHVHLLSLVDAGPARACLQLNPEAASSEKTLLQALQRTLTLARPHSAINGTSFGHFAVQAPSLSAACILHPDEPDLDGFFRQFPDWVQELVVVWDAEQVPEQSINAACPVRQTARPLGEDFAAQRNHMLKHCQAEWVLYLDADERLSEDHWVMLPGLFPVRGVQGYFFPRLTFHPDEEHCRIGYGLWPDLQLRLFRNQPEVRFENAIHEKITGLSGRAGLVLDAPLLHYSHSRKKPEALREKLALFDRASRGAVHHTLNENYPHLPLSRFRRANLLCNELQVLLLPEMPL
ncbi:MAG: glycosyl transferase family 2 [Desulfovibrionaceae bacterium]